MVRCLIRTGRILFRGFDILDFACSFDQAELGSPH